MQDYVIMDISEFSIYIHNPEIKMCLHLTDQLVYRDKYTISLGEFDRL